MNNEDYQRDGFICLWRTMKNWEWFTDVNTAHLFVYCLISANHKDKKYKGTLIKRGSFVTSYSKISAETGLSVQNIRTSLKKLKSTQEITYKTSTKGTVIIVQNYSKYQNYNKRSNNQLTINQQTANKRLTTNNNDNNDNNVNNTLSSRESRESFPSFQAPTSDDVMKYASSKSRADIADEFYSYNSARGWKINGSHVENWKALFDMFAMKHPKAEESEEYYY